MTAPTHTLFQFSDLHITREGDLLYGQVDTMANLAAALGMVEHAAVRADALLFTGDLTDNGDPLAYARIRAAVGPVAERLGVPALYAMGNHDDRAAFRRGLLKDSAAGAEFDYTRSIGDLRMIVLDSSVPGRIDGALSGDQLSWLRMELATPAPGGTVIAMHHPPVPVPLSLEPFTLQSPHQLADVISGTDLRIILCGHAHQSCAALLAGVPVWISGATAYRLDALSANLRGMRGGVFSRIDLFADNVVATQVPITDDVALYEITAAEVTAKPA